MSTFVYGYSPRTNTMPGKTFPFEGQALTVAQVHAMAPAYCRSVIQRALAEGCQSRADLRDRDQRMKARIKEGARRGGKKSPVRIAPLSTGYDRGHLRNDLDGMGVAR
jgi:hypothetical protein